MNYLTKEPLRKGCKTGDLSCLSLFLSKDLLVLILTGSIMKESFGFVRCDQLFLDKGLRILLGSNGSRLCLVIMLIVGIVHL
jgi:hypothetical protein